MYCWAMPQPQLCVTVSAETTDELRARRDAETAADLVELRLDSVRDPDVAGALNGRRGPVLVTCRPRWEGGSFDGAEEERRRLLHDALAAGAEYVDLEWRGGFDALIEARHGRNVVLSMHDFEATPEDLAERYRAMRRTGAAVVKMAVRTHRLCDLLPLLDLGAATPAQERVVLIGMGPAGLPSRILAARFGSYWTYCGRAAPGQIDIAEMLVGYRFRALSASTEVYGVVGNPIGHSLSPVMHNAAFETSRQDAVYVPFEAADIDDFLRFANRLPMRGASVTAPFKEAVRQRIEDIDATGRRVGAINTVRADRGRWAGVNTDVGGFLEPLQRRFSLADVRVAVIGSGGAARAVAVALSTAGARVAVHARNTSRARSVAALADGTAHGLTPAPGSWDLLVNTTPVGTYPHNEDTPLPDVPLDGQMVYDLVYNPAETRLLRDARRAGCATLGGLEMLVEQARRQFDWWTGVRLATEVFRQAALDRMRGAEQEPCN